MSYYFDMCFWSASSLSTAMKKAQEVVAACCTTECMRQTLEDILVLCRLCRQLPGGWLCRERNLFDVPWHRQRCTGCYEHGAL